MMYLGKVFFVSCIHCFTVTVSAFVTYHNTPTIPGKSITIKHLRRPFRLYGSAETGSAKQNTDGRRFDRQEEEEGKQKVDPSLIIDKFRLVVDKFLAELDQSVDDMDESLTLVSSIPWKFRGHDINCQVSRPGREKKKRSSSTVSKKMPVVLLVHGFGCSIIYWRETVQALTKAGYTVYAMDLLGHGKSSKPSNDVVYSTNLWSQQLDDFCKENLAGDEDIVLVGNSMGSIIALLAATGEFSTKESSSLPSSPYIREHVTGIGMFNSGIGMNIHSITRDKKWNKLQRFFLETIFEFLESNIFGNIALMKWILDKVITKELLRNTLLQLYRSASNPEEIVDDELVESFYGPAKDDTESTAKVLSQILTNDAGLTPMEVFAKNRESSSSFLRDLPIHLVWGDSDTVTPIDGVGEVGQFYSALATDNDGNNVTLEVIKGGHIPFDEVPDAANGSMLRWLNKLVLQ